MSWLVRSAIFVVFLPCTVVAAAQFGALHDRIGYAAAPEYLTRFKVMPFLLVALGGLAYGWLRTATIDPAAYRGWFIAPGVTDLRRYLCAGFMHDAAYLGSVLAVPMAWIFQVA